MKPLPAALRSALRKAGPRVKLNAVLLVAMLASFGAAVWSFNERFAAAALAETTREAEINMRAALAVRSFISDEVTPIFAEHLPAGVWLQSVPAYAAQRTMRSVYEEHGAGYSYREAALSPLNPANKARDWEVSLVERYRSGVLRGQHAEPQRRSGVDVLLISRPIRVGSIKCLQCHGEPGRAPESIRKTYGVTSGYHWQLGEVVGAQIVEVPAAVPIARAHASLRDLLGFLASFFLILFVALNAMLDRLVIGPLDQANARLRDIAWTDALTGAANRRSFLRALDAALRQRAPLALLMLDLDHFKSINDRFGHGAGDTVLASVSRAVAATVRARDCLGRLGGEEFAVLLPRTDGGGALVVAEALRQAVEALAIDGVGRVTASFGCAEWDGAETASELLERADLALYEAKRGGRNRVVACPPDPARAAALACFSAPAPPARTARH